MKKTVTHYYRLPNGIILPYYTAVVESLPCMHCSGKIAVPKLYKPWEKK